MIARIIHRMEDDASDVPPKDAQEREDRLLTQFRESLERDEERKRQRYSSRPCPACGEMTMRALRRTPAQRLLGVLGVRRRRYRCATCHKRWAFKTRKSLNS